MLRQVIAVFLTSASLAVTSFVVLPMSAEAQVRKDVSEYAGQRCNVPKKAAASSSASSAALTTRPSLPAATGWSRSTVSGASAVCQNARAGSIRCKANTPMPGPLLWCVAPSAESEL